MNFLLMVAAVLTLAGKPLLHADEFVLGALKSDAGQTRTKTGLLLTVDVPVDRDFHVDIYRVVVPSKHDKNLVAGLLAAAASGSTKDIEFPKVLTVEDVFGGPMGMRLASADAKKKIEEELAANLWVVYRWGRSKGGRQEPADKAASEERPCGYERRRLVRETPDRGLDPEKLECLETGKNENSSCPRYEIFKNLANGETLKVTRNESGFLCTMEVIKDIPEASAPAVLRPIRASFLSAFEKGALTDLGQVLQVTVSDPNTFPTQILVGSPRQKDLVANLFESLYSAGPVVATIDEAVKFERSRQPSLKADDVFKTLESRLGGHVAAVCRRGK